MKFFKFWTKSSSARKTFDHPPKDIKIECYGYSNISLADALAVAEKRATKAIDRLLSGEMLQRGEDYYDRGPIREEVIEEFADDSGEAIATITRNSYGCLILNTSNVFFADVDLGLKPKRRFNSFWNMLFGKRSKPANADADAAKILSEKLVNAIQTLVAQDPSLLFRLYRTRMGFRIMIVSQLFPAGDAYATKLMEELNTDRLYICLCKSQDCYRARLSPKPWRCGHKRPTVKFPYLTQTKRNEMERWLVEYEKLAPNFATCHLIAQFGSAQPHPVAMRVAQLHDHYCIKDGDQSLA